MSEKTFNTVLGLPLSRKALRVLKNARIYAPAMVTLEHQHLAKRMWSVAWRLVGQFQI